jgi:recombination protein RecA
MSRATHLRAVLPEQWSQSGSRLLFFPSAAPGPDAGADAGRPTLAALRGRVTEVSGTRPAAALTLTVRWVVEAQAAGEAAVWLQGPDGLLFPPDLADAGVDLDRLLVARLPDGDAIARAADFLLRSGGVGLAVLDLLAPGDERRTPGAAAPGSTTVTPRRGGWLNRLLALALAHQAGVVCLTATPDDRPSLASLVGLRVGPRLTRLPRGGFRLDTTVLKDKRSQPHRNYQEVCRGPLGLR